MRVSVDTGAMMALGGGSAPLRKAKAAEKKVSTMAGSTGASPARVVVQRAIFFTKLLILLARRRRENLRVSLVFAIFAGVVEFGELIVGEKQADERLVVLRTVDAKSKLISTCSITVLEPQVCMQDVSQWVD
jgi:hypothetical protein